MTEPTADKMRRMGETEQSIAHWATQQILWNGEPVIVAARSQNFPAENTGD